MAKTPDIRVRIRADGVASARASFKALQASASRSFSHIERSAAQAAATVRTLSRPVSITIRGVASIARTTALVGTLAGALAGLEVSKDLDAGQSFTSMKAGLKVAIDRTGELEGQLAEAEKRMTSLGNSGSGGFGAARDEVFRLRGELAKSRDVSAQVDKQFNGVRKTADELGVELSKVGPAFVALANSTKGTNAAGATTERTFRGILMAGSALGRTNEEVEGSLLALQQIAGKGKVSMEELRGQLGERLPGAMNIAARAMGTNPAGLETMVAKGLDASIFLDRFSRQLVKEFAPAAEEAAKRPAASFARLRNRIFLARSEAANGGLARGLATIADSASVMIDRLEATGAFERTGARIGAMIEKLPAFFAAVSHEVGVLRWYTNEWVRQMGVALGLDVSGWASNTAGAFGWVRAMLLQLAFDIPGVIYALRQAFAGNDSEVSDRYAWVLTLRDFIQGQLMPLLDQVPAMLDRWVPIFVGIGKAFIGTLEAIRETMVSIFGEEGANKIAAFLIIGKLTGMLSLVAGALSVVGTAVRGVVAAFNILRAASVVMFAPPAGLIVAAIAAVAALAYVVYKNWDSIKAFLVGVWEKVSDSVSGFIDGLKAAWDGLADFLKKPFELAKKAISAILDGLKKAVEYSPVGLLFKGGKFLIEQGTKIPGYANGGMIRGPGTTTSDSIPIMASNKEGMLNAKATEYYGGKPFIDGLNNMTIPFGAFGVPEVGGGSPGRPLSLSIPGLGSASGKADDDLADGLQRLFERKTAGRARQRKPRGHR